MPALQMPMQNFLQDLHMLLACSSGMWCKLAATAAVTTMSEQSSSCNSPFPASLNQINALPDPSAHLLPLLKRRWYFQLPTGAVPPTILAGLL